ncbi:MAG: hypothetical protein NVS4B12_10500 [Ktedonobacteraceae bacterium]
MNEVDFTFIEQNILEIEQTQRLLQRQNMLQREAQDVVRELEAGGLAHYALVWPVMSDEGVMMYHNIFLNTKPICSIRTKPNHS